MSCACAGKSALALKRVGMVCQRKEIKIFHIGRVLERLLHRSCSVGKIRVSVKLSEIQAIVLDHHRRLIDKGIDLPGLCLCISVLGNIGQCLYNNRLILLRSSRDLHGLCVELLCVSCLRICRLCSVCIHCIVDLRAVSSFQSDLLSFHHAGAALRRRFHLKTFYCSRFVRLIRIARLVCYLIELQGEHSLTALCNVVVCTPVPVAVIPLHIRFANCILHIIKSFSCVFKDPLVIFLSQRHAGIAVSHTNILSIIGEAVSPVLVNCNCPDICICISGKGSVALYCHICAFVVETIVLS